MACRSLDRGQRAMTKIKKTAPSAELELMELDLASLNSIRSFASNFKETHDRLDVLVNNGGLVGPKKSLTADGFESQFGVNYLGHFALTGLLLEVLLDTPNSRVVSVGSRMQADASIAWDDLMGEDSYDRWQAYGQSKLANLMFSFELARRLDAWEKSNRSIGVHPGLANTSWADNNMSGVMKVIGKLMSFLTYQSTEMGALPLLFAATAPEAKNGGYYGPENDTKGYPVEIRAADHTYDETNAKRLWALSEELTGVTFATLDS
jgi:NAD(P)-dependent dehydrogenase (short-subunit alcohol dehydrogenase family)